MALILSLQEKTNTVHIIFIIIFNLFNIFLLGTNRAEGCEDHWHNDLLFLRSGGAFDVGRCRWTLPVHVSLIAGSDTQNVSDNLILQYKGTLASFSLVAKFNRVYAFRFVFICSKRQEDFVSAILMTLLLMSLISGMRDANQLTAQGTGRVTRGGRSKFGSYYSSTAPTVANDAIAELE